MTGPINDEELKNIESVLSMFGNTLEVLEASEGIFRFKVKSHRL
jgi:hypothetical protein